MAAIQKTYLREVLGACRRSLPACYATAASAAIQTRLRASALYAERSTVVLYAAKENEIATDRLLDDALASGRRVCFPRVRPIAHELELVRVTDPGELTPGAFGVLEPSGTEVVPAALLGPALICVPGLAFTPDGHRLGRGGGYYDRLLAAAGPELSSIGLAYAFQLLDQLPVSPGDRRLNLILSESAWYAAAAPTPPPARIAQGGSSRCG